MLRFFADRSELTRPSNIVAVGGLLADSDDWVAVEADWRAVLERYSVDRFHMTDFEAHQYPFGWPDERRIQFLRSLVAVLRGRVLLGMATGLIVTDFEKLEPEDRAVFRHPYAFCGAHMASQVLRWVDMAFGADVPVAFVFEAGDEGAGTMAEEFSPQNLGPLASRILSVSFESNRNIMALQAADMVAYEYTKMVTRRVGTETRPVRQLLQLLIRTFPLAGVYFTYRGLKGFADESHLLKACRAAIEAGNDEEVSRLMREFHAERNGRTGWVDLFAPETWGPRLDINW